MKSYLNDPKLKSSFLKEITKHEKADAIIQGTYGEMAGKEWKGCAVACSLRSLEKIEGKESKEVRYSDHALYESKLGMPEWLARLEDKIFEGLPKKEAKTWPRRFAEAVPVGADLEPVKWKFSAYLMKENIDRVLSLDIAEDLKKQVVDAIRGVLSLHQTAIETGVWDESAAWSAESAARSAARSAWSAAWSAESAESAAWSAARSAWSAESAARSAESAESAARSAARSAWSAAWSAESAESAARSAESAAYIRHSKELLKMLSEAV